MVDRVQGIGNIPARAVQPFAAGVAASADVGLAAEPAGMEKPRLAAVSVSAMASAKELAASPPVDSSRVASLRESIADGSYRIDAEAIAAAMIRSELP